MALGNRRLGMSAIGLLLCASLLLTGCDKPPPQPPSYPTVILTGTDITREGTFTPEALQKIQAKSDEGEFVISVQRINIKDPALLQLANVKNILKIEAIGSPLSQAAIAKFKKAHPKTEVVK